MSEEIEEIRRSIRTYLEVNEGTTEFDQSINELSRSLVRAVAQANSGEAWLGRINFYQAEDLVEGKWKEVMWKFEGEGPLNFEASFVAPQFDEELVRLIEERRDAEYEGTRADMARINAIFERLEAIGGHGLHWS